MKVCKALFCGLVLLGFSAPSLVSAARVVSVVTAKVKGDDSVYLAKLRAAKPIVMRLGASNYRVFRAAFAGETSGAVVSIAEYKDWATFAEARAKRTTDEEFQMWYRDLLASDTSELVSIDLLEEIELAP